MNGILATALAVLIHLGSASIGSSHIQGDLDGDGKPDELLASPVDFMQDGSVSLELVIRLSTQRTPIRARLTSQTPDLQTYISGGTLVVDRGTQSRDAAELSYASYRWDSDRKRFCLNTEVTGVPPNQLQGEWLPRDVEVSRYAPCAALGEDDRPKPVASALARKLALDEARTLGKGEPAPDYLAFELASLVDQRTVTLINNIGFHQEQAGFLRPALIILSGVNARFPRRTAAQLNLADTYWKLGDEERACRLYQKYLVSTPAKGGLGRQRALDRARCHQ